MIDFPTEGDDAVAVDTADESSYEDHSYDTFDEALEALGDDDEGEAPEAPEEEPEAEDGEEEDGGHRRTSDVKVSAHTHGLRSHVSGPLMWPHSEWKPLTAL